MQSKPLEYRPHLTRAPHHVQRRRKLVKTSFRRTAEEDDYTRLADSQDYDAVPEENGIKLNAELYFANVKVRCVCCIMKICIFSIFGS